LGRHDELIKQGFTEFAHLIQPFVETIDSLVFVCNTTDNYITSIYDIFMYCAAQKKLLTMRLLRCCTKKMRRKVGSKKVTKKASNKRK
jgi:hypothetical protein